MPSGRFLPQKLLVNRKEFFRLVYMLAFPSLMAVLTQYLASLLDVLFLRGSCQQVAWLIFLTYMVINYSQICFRT